MKMRYLSIAMALLFTGGPLLAQGRLARLMKEKADSVEYRAEVQVSAGKGKEPFWLNANKYGLSSVHNSNGYLRAGLFRPEQADANKKWRLGYGLDLAAAYDFQRSVILQQLYIDINYKRVRLGIGQKERPAVFKNRLLSSGSQTFGTNARPIPEIRFEIPDYLSITGKSNWLAVKGHFGYGMLTDGRWQRGYVSPQERNIKKALYHSKAGYLRIGNEEKFPLVLEGGLEMACMFGGTIRGVYDDFGNELSIDMGTGIKDFLSAVVAGGSDATDGVYANAAGNTVGSWTFSLSYVGKDWKLRAYYDHYFEDHSMMFFQYGWLDGLIGLEATLPRNPVVAAVVYEYMHTKYQSGALYHDHTSLVPDQISGRDNYYNHNIYWGWQHWGQAIGNPLFHSPLYNNNEGTLTFMSNRFLAHHLGISGNPCTSFSYRMLYTYSRHWGTYEMPYEEVKDCHSFLTELTFSPQRLGRLHTQGWSLSAAFGLDRGSQLGKNTGAQITLRKTGLFH